MYLSESQMEKWGPVLDHPELPQIKERKLFVKRSKLSLKATMLLRTLTTMIQY